MANEETQHSVVVSDIQRFSIHDGPGVRTTVFLKGCPLSCRWCHNPETHFDYPQAQYTGFRCLQCGACAEVCLMGCHTFDEKGHHFDSAKCIRCMNCVDACPSKAMKVCGKRMTANQIVDEAEKDVAFYGEDGGITLSGGEPMMHIEAALEIIAVAKARGLNVCVETCGEFDFESCSDFFCQHVDHIFWDVKFLDRALHTEYCGVPNDTILHNLTLAAARRPDIICRTVIVKGLTDNEAHVRPIAAYIKKLGIKNPLVLLPFHPYGSSKGEAVGMASYPFMGEEYIPDDDTVKTLSLLARDISEASES